MNKARFTHLPYCIEQVGKGLYVILHRGYKPLGIVGPGRVDYKDHAIPLRISAEDARAISWNNDPNTSKVYLYDDGSIPTSSTEARNRYIERVTRLGRLLLVCE